jgi:hypothetical protein
VPLLVDLRREPAQDALSLSLVGRRLTQVELATRQWVHARVDDDLERATTLTDRPTLTAAGGHSRHPSRILDATVAAIDRTMIAD